VSKLEGWYPGCSENATDLWGFRIWWQAKYSSECL